MTSVSSVRVMILLKLSRVLAFIIGPFVSQVLTRKFNGSDFEFPRYPF